MRRVTSILIAVLALAGLAAAGLAVAGCGSSQSGTSSDSVATVGGVQVTKADFQQLMTQAQTQMKASGMTVPAAGSPTYNHYVAAIVTYLVQEQLVAQSAAKLGVSVTDKEVADQVAQMEKAYGGEQKLVALLKQQGMTMDLLKRSVKAQTLAQRAAAVVTKGATVTPAEIKAYWNAHKSQYLKKKATNTLAKAEATIKKTVLSAKQQQAWSAWLDQRTKDLGVTYASGFDPAKLNAAAMSPTPSASSSATP